LHQKISQQLVSEAGDAYGEFTRQQLFTERMCFKMLNNFSLEMTETIKSNYMRRLVAINSSDMSCSLLNSIESSLKWWLYNAAWSKLHFFQNICAPSAYPFLTSPT
jgi:hypothetical protein